MGKVKRKLKRNNHEESYSVPDVVSLEYYDQLTGEVELYVELSRSDFEQYSMAAESTGVSVEDLVLKAARAEVNNRNTQWVSPAIDSDGNLDLANGSPVVLPPFGKDEQ